MQKRLDHGPMFVTAATSAAPDPVEAAREIAAQISISDSCFALAFIAGGQDMIAMAAELDRQLRGLPVFGCSSAGQITGRGYENEGILVLAFPKQHFRCASILIDNLSPHSSTDIAAEMQRQSHKFRHTAGWNRLGLLFTDGLCHEEDVLVSTLEAVLYDLPIFGGSAGDRLKFEETHVLHGGKAYPNAALLLLLETDLPFAAVGFDHFLPGETQLVITDADPDARKVFEINGAPAASEYARLVGCSVADLSPQIFAENPLLVEYRNHHYVRAIADADAAGALSFMAAIDDGLVMRLGQGQEIVKTLKSGLSIRDAAGGDPDFILGFDCVLRKLEIEQKQLEEQVSDALRKARVFGFNTFGEQQGGVHMNQTFVGVAFFPPEGTTLP